MFLKFLIVPGRIRFPIVVCCAVMICILSLDCSAQSKRRDLNQDSLPRVGTIKDYPATGLMTGCANLYFYPAAQPRSLNTAYVFLARNDGSNAWMNLGGRDVRLRQVKLLTQGNLLTSENRKAQRYYYRLGKLRVGVFIEDFKPQTEPAEEGDHMFKMKITLRKGRAMRTVRAVGGADC